MERSTRVGLSVVVAAVLTVAPALAQRRGGGGHSARASSGRAATQHGGRSAGGRGAGSAGTFVPRSARGVRPPSAFLGHYSFGAPRPHSPYYVFRPHVFIGLGLWAGYPIAYGYPYEDTGGYSYLDPYGYDVAPRAPSAPPDGVSDDPARVPQTDNILSVLGGLTFDVTPDDADVFIDGRLVGSVGQFSSASRPLSLTPGRHQVQIRAAGFSALGFHVDITAGQVMPFQGTLER
jgi:hypothetical protein